MLNEPALYMFYDNNESKQSLNKHDNGDVGNIDPRYPTGVIPTPSLNHKVHYICNYRQEIEISLTVPF